MIFGDWRDTRAAITKAYESRGETWAPNGDRREWEIVDAAIKADREAHRKPCSLCNRLLYLGEEIRCLDCKSVLCERCAPAHFWPPSGRRPDGNRHREPRPRRSTTAGAAERSVHRPRWRQNGPTPPAPLPSRP